jgi:hypothetical protein
VSTPEEQARVACRQAIELDHENERLREALAALWDSLSPMERHHTPKAVCDKVQAVLNG